jgi:MOSC domain-containing protein YiiM
VILSVNLADVRTVPRHGEHVATGIWKLPAAGRVAVGRLGLSGDTQADPSVHGGVDKAVYAYAREDTEWWEAELGRRLENGTFGENLTLEGVDLSGALVGERWRAGSSLLEVSEPRFPCWKLGVKMGDPGFLLRFAKALRPGAYLRVIEDGELGAGDAVELAERPDHDVTIRLMAEAVLSDHGLAPRLLAASALSAEYRKWAERYAV